MSVGGRGREEERVEGRGGQPGPAGGMRRGGRQERQRDSRAQPCPPPTPPLAPHPGFVDSGHLLSVVRPFRAREG